MKLTLKEISQHVQGTLHGDETREIIGCETIRDAHEGHITFATNDSLANKLENCRASAVIVPVGFEPESHDFITVPDVRKAFENTVELFCPPRQTNTPGISPQAYIGETVKLGKNVNVHPGANIGDDVVIGDNSTIHGGVVVMAGTTIGSDTTLFPNVTIYENTVIGNRCIFHACSVIGAYGFGYETVDGQHILSAQLGNVIIEDDVEIGANSTVDRGTYSSTIIGQGTKIDNLVMVAHNCRIGKGNFMCSQVGIAGSCSTGDYVVMAGQVGIADHIHIGDQSVLGAQAGGMSDIPGGNNFVGSPAVPLRNEMHKQAALQRLPQLRKDFKKLQRRVEELESIHQEQEQDQGHDQERSDAA